MMTESQVWAKACLILAEHGTLTADFIIGELAAVLDNTVAVEDWPRVAAAVDEITDTSIHGAN